MSKEITEPPSSVTNPKGQGVLCSKDLLGCCADCQYFVPSRENEFTGICRRYPPSVKDRFGVDYWPTVGCGAWCGEYKQPNDQALRPGQTQTKL